MNPSSNVKSTSIPDFVPGSLIGETARFFGLHSPPVVPQKPVAIRPNTSSDRYISPPATTTMPKNVVTPIRVMPVARRTLKLPNNHNNLKYDLNSGTKNHKSKVNTRRRH